MREPVPVDGDPMIAVTDHEIVVFCLGVIAGIIWMLLFVIAAGGQ